MQTFPSTLILAIDTSCDDTSAAVTLGRVVLSNVIASQTELHKQYGGVFPTVAKQAHRENIEPVVKLALKKAGVTLEQLDAIAVTRGPGLAPALEVGIEYAKKLATETGKPLIPVNHIEGHVLSVLAIPRPLKTSLENISQPPMPLFPVLSIIVSGGHTEFVKVEAPGKYQRLGWTVDDAAGEALDKFGRMVDLGYPAGPVVEELAKVGKADAFPFPVPMMSSGDYNVSFSGLKTSVRQRVEELAKAEPLSKQQVVDMCASFQFAVFRAITYKLNKILQKEQFFGIWLGGGVAANLSLRHHLRQTIHKYALELTVPYTKKLCMDNAAMIGVAASFGQATTNIEDVERTPRWEIA